MILIPELETVVILTPRTGTRALKNAVAARWPRSILLYRHMEADGVPRGYDRWRKIGVVREPVARLFSLYKYLQRFGLDWCEEHDETYTARQRESVAQPFEDWMMRNELPFTTPYDSAGRGRFFPAYSVNHPIPENRKSQFVYLRPDLGTEIVPYREIERLHRRLRIDPQHANVSPRGEAPLLSAEAQAYVARWFAWDSDNS